MEKANAAYIKKRKKLPRIRGVVLSVILCALIIALAYIAQSMILPFIALPATPLILPLAAISVAMFGGASKGAVFGMAAGALADVSFLKPISTFMLTLTIICLIVGVLCDRLFARGFVPYLIISIPTLAICAFIQMFELLVYAGAPSTPLLRVALTQTAVSMPFTIIIYPLAMLASKPHMRSA